MKPEHPLGPDQLAHLDIILEGKVGARIVGPAETVTYQAQVVRVIDGDTLKVTVAGFPEVFTPIDVRVYGIDAPEHQLPPAQDEAEVALGLAAKDFALGLVAVGATVTLVMSATRRDKYGRLLAHVTLPDGGDWGGRMIAAGHARPYGDDGNLHKPRWV